MYLAIEAPLGVLSSSAGLLSDAGHNLADVATLLISLVAINLADSQSRTTRRLTFANVLLLIATVILISSDA
ncbi:MAG: hypothetical protein ACI3ZP_02265 [Candidatus Cryptobacteroides sp.]